MFRGQVYNSSPWQSPHQNRRIKQNLGIMDRSRNSNHSGSIRIKRTEHSGDRTNMSRQRGVDSQQISGLTSEDFNDSVRRVPRRMGSVLSLSRRRNGPQGHKIQAAASRSGKNIVENLYMLTNNVPQYAGRNPQPQRYPDPYDDAYSSRGSRQQYEYRDRYERIGERRPQQSPHAHYLDSPRSNGVVTPRRYHGQSPRHFPQQSPQRYPQQSPNRYADSHRYPERSQDRYRDESARKRQQTPTRGSILRSRRSKEGSRLRIQRSDASRDRDRYYKQVGSSRDTSRRYPEVQIRKLEEKYAENIYELNSNNKQRAGHRGQRPGKDARSRNRYYLDRGEPRHERGQRKVHGSRRQYEPDPYHDERRSRGQKYPQYGTRNSDEEWYQDEDQYRDVYREEDFYPEEDIYHQRGRNGQPKKKMDKFKTNYSGKYNPYYPQQQIPSTTTGAKTEPVISKYDTISDASIPIQSIKSQKNIPKHRQVQPLQKKNLKLDRPKQKINKYGRQKEHAVKRQNQWQSPYQESDIDDRLKRNNIYIKQRALQKGDVKHSKKQKFIDNRFEPTNLPSGSVFLPVESKRPQKRDWADEITQKIIVHLQTLNLIADYTKDFKTMYQNTQPWQILIFLTYKKFYIERTKVVNILRNTNKDEPQDGSAFQNLPLFLNPFTLPYSKISDQEVRKFKQTRECFALMIELESENSTIRDALRGLYNRYIQKSGDHVNMLDCDNFSQEIYKYMKEQLHGISENIADPELVTATRLRMGKIIKVGLLIGFLNGKYIKNFSQILIHEDLIKIGKRETLRQDNISKLFLSQFKQILT